jgi:hypothetical protein
VKPKQATTNTITRLTRQTRQDNPKDSHMSIKWQPQERLKIQRTGTIGNIWTHTWPLQKCAVSGMSIPFAPCCSAVFVVGQESHGMQD